MKNSTLINILLISGGYGYLYYLFPYVMGIIFLALLIVFFIFYFVGCMIEYEYEDLIKHKYNFLVQISKFYKWVDSKPRIIKPSKKNWRAPNNWEKDI